MKPHVSFEHDGKMLLERNPNSAYVSIAGVTVKTHQLQKRLQQAGCVAKTGGNVFACAPDLPVDHGGRVLDVSPWGQMMGVVGICR